MNIIKRIGVALTLVLGGSTTKSQAEELIKSYPNEFGWTVDNKTYNELQRRSERLAFIEGCGYELKSEFKAPKTFPQEPPEKPTAPQKEEGRKNWGNSVVENAILRSIDRLQKKQFTSGDVWAEYVRSREPMTSRDVINATVSQLGANGMIQKCNPPKKIGLSIVYEKQ